MYLGRLDESRGTMRVPKRVPKLPGTVRGWSIALKPRTDGRPPEPRRDARRVEPMLTAPPRAVMHSIAHSLRLKAQGLGQLAHCDEFAAHAGRPGTHRIHSVAPVHATVRKSL